MRNITPVAFMLLLGFCLSCTKVSTQEQSSTEPFPAPSFELKDFKTDKVIKLADFRGKPIIINFWFAGCPPCRWEAPGLKRFSEENPDIIVLSITEPELNPGKAIEQFLDEFGWQFPVLIDSTGNVTKSFDKNMAYPTTFLVNKELKIVGKVVSYIEWDTPEMKDVVEHLRNGKLLWYYRYLGRLK